MCTQAYTKTYALITHGLTIESMQKYMRDHIGITPITDRHDNPIRCQYCGESYGDIPYQMSMDGWASIENPIDFALEENRKALVTVSFKVLIYLRSKLSTILNSSTL